MGHWGYLTPTNGVFWDPTFLTSFGAHFVPKVFQHHPFPPPEKSQLLDILKLQEWLHPIFVSKISVVSGRLLVPSEFHCRVKMILKKQLISPQLAADMILKKYQ